MKAIIRPTPELAGDIRALPSKNYTTRYLLAAALAEGESVLIRPARSEDGEAMRRCLRELGADLREEGERLVVRGFGRNPRPVRELNAGNAGAVLRFLMAVAAFLPEVTFVNAYPESLGKRPHLDLIRALERMGVRVEHRDGRLPITVFGGRPKGGRIEVSGAVSSQYLSALLFVTPLLNEDSEIVVTGGLKSKVVVPQTLEVIGQAGVRIEASGDLLFYRVPGRQSYRPGVYEVQGDYPGSAAIMAAAAVTRSDVAIRGLPATSRQGERAAVDVLRKMGVAIEHEGDVVRVRGTGNLKGGEFDGDAFTDAVLALAAAAVFADGTTRFYNVENLRYKECDRITDFLAELRKAGADVEERRDEIIIHGRPKGVEGGAEIDAHYDHRVIMALSVVGLRSKNGLVIRDAQYVAKSYPEFFDHLRALGAAVELMED